MASGQVNRVKRPNTWLQRPMLQNREGSSCQTGAVHTWHICDMPTGPDDVLPKIVADCEAFYIPCSWPGLTLGDSFLL